VNVIMDDDHVIMEGATAAAPADKTATAG